MSTTKVTNDNIVSVGGSKLTGTLQAGSFPAALPTISGANLTNLPAAELGYQNISGWADDTTQTVSLSTNTQGTAKAAIKIWEEFADPNNPYTDANWDISTNDTGFDLTDSAYAQTLTPAAITGDSIDFTMGGGTFAATDLGKVITNTSSGETGQARIISIASNVATCKINTDFTNTDAIASGDWTMKSGLFEEGKFALSDASQGGDGPAHAFNGDVKFGRHTMPVVTMLTPTVGCVVYTPDANTATYVAEVTVSGTTITTGTPAVLHSVNNTAAENITLKRLSDTKAVVSYRAADNNKGGQGPAMLRCILIGSSSMTVGAEEQLSTAQTNWNSLYGGGYLGYFASYVTIEPISETQILYAYQGDQCWPQYSSSSSGTGLCVGEVTNAGTTFSQHAGSHDQKLIDTGGGAFPKMVKLSDVPNDGTHAQNALARVAIMYRGYNNGKQMTSIVHPVFNGNALQYMTTPLQAATLGNSNQQHWDIRKITPTTYMMIWVPGANPIIPTINIYEDQGGVSGFPTIYLRSSTPIPAMASTPNTDTSDFCPALEVLSPSKAVLRWLYLAPSNYPNYEWRNTVIDIGDMSPGSAFQITNITTTIAEAMVNEAGAIGMSSTLYDTNKIMYAKTNQNGGTYHSPHVAELFTHELGSSLYVTNQYVTTISGTDSVDTTNYSDLNSMTVTETLNGGTANFAFSTNSTPSSSVVTGGTFFVIGSGQTTTRDIASSLASVHGGVDGTWYINNNTTYGSTTWVAAATNEAKEAIAEATAVTENQMSGTSVNGVIDTSWPALSTQLSVAITLHSTDASKSPTVDGISFSYDGAIINRDNTGQYVIEMLDNSSVKITAPSSGGPRNARVYITS